MSLGEPCNRQPPRRERVLYGRLSKTCGPFQTYQHRIVELHPSFLYLFHDGEGDAAATQPYSRIPLEGLTVANNSESPNGFSLVAPDGRKVKFIAESLDSKRVWTGQLRKEIEKAAPKDSEGKLVGSGGGAAGTFMSSAKFHLDRSQPSICEGFLQKRNGMSAYHPRWCEARRNVGIAYGKYKSSADDSFKVLGLRGRHVAFSEEKLRFTIETEDDVYHFKCATVDDFALWRDAIAQIDSAAVASPAAAAGAAGMYTTTGAGPHHRGVGGAGPLRQAMDADGGGDGLDDDVEAIDGETLMELADLEAPSPIRGTAQSPERERSKRLRSGAITVESVCREYNARRASPGFKERFDAFVQTRLAHELGDMVDRFLDRMFVPVTRPFTAVNEHLNLLDLDASKLRNLLNEILDNFGEEEGAFPAIERIDAALRLYRCVREQLVVRRDIATFREQAGKAGLPLGIDGTIHFIEKMLQQERGEVKPEQWQKVKHTVAQLYDALEEFRLDFDVFDESEETILDVEAAIEAGEQWLDVHLPRAGGAVPT